MAISDENDRPLRDFMEDMAPVNRHIFYLLIREFENVRDEVGLNDFIDLARALLKNVPNLVSLLEGLSSGMDLWKTVSPAVGPTWPHLVKGMGRLEEEGVFKNLAALREALKKLNSSLDPEKIEKIGDSMVFLTGLLPKLADPRIQSLLSKSVDMLAETDLSAAKPVGTFGMLGAMRSPESREGLGVAMELMKQLGKLK